MEKKGEPTLMKILLQRKENKHDAEGFTLIEILGVLLLITIIMGLAVPAVRSQYKYYIRASARKLAATYAYLYNEAVLKQRTYRIVYDLDAKKYWIESAAGALLISTSPEEEEKDLKEGEVPSGPQFRKEEGALAKETKLGKGVSFKDILLPRYSEPITAGIAYTYILPQGYIEETWVHFEDLQGQNYTITVNPVTGRPTTYGRYVEPGKE